MFQAALTVRNIDADSDMGTSVITDHKSLCRFSDIKEVSECVYMCVRKAEIFVLWSLPRIL